MERWRAALAISAVVAMAAVAAAAVVVAVDNAPVVAPAPEGDPVLSDRINRLKADLQAAEERLATVRAQQKELKQRVVEGQQRAEALRRLTKELTLADGPGSCAQASSISVDILTPEAGSATASPVVAHLLATDPLGCQARYYLTVDGVPFGPRDSSTGPGSAEEPVPYRPMRNADPADACVTAVYRYVELDLSPGLHSLQVNRGCGGSAQAETASVAFTVTG